MSTERDTHFQGFARLLWIAIVQSPEWPTINLDEETIQQAETVIAQRAYDFASHVLDETTENELWMFKAGEYEMENIVPDLTEWPKPE